MLGFQGQRVLCPPLPRGGSCWLSSSLLSSSFMLPPHHLRGQIPLMNPRYLYDNFRGPYLGLMSKCIFPPSLPSVKHVPDISVISSYLQFLEWHMLFHNCVPWHTGAWFWYVLPSTYLPTSALSSWQTSIHPPKSHSNVNSSVKLSLHYRVLLRFSLL